MGNGQKRSAFWRLGELIARRRRIILIAWLLVMAAAAPFAAKITDRLSQGGFAVPGSQSDQVKQAVDEQFPKRFEFSNLVVLHSDSVGARARDIAPALLNGARSLWKTEEYGFTPVSTMATTTGRTAIEPATLSDPTGALATQPERTDANARVASAPLIGTSSMKRRFECSCTLVATWRSERDNT